MNSRDVIKKIIDDGSDIRFLRFLTFSFKNKVQDRAGQLSDSEAKAIDAALTLKKFEGVRFWDAFLRTCVASGVPSQRMMSYALHHNPNSALITVARDELDDFFISLDGDVAINSEVIMSDGSTRHIPLLDFKVAVSDIGTDVVSAAIRSLGLTGYILSSGKSYHFISRSTVSCSEIVDILAKFILLHPISDQAWAAHQIIERSASLRITSKSGLEPRLLQVV